MPLRAHFDKATGLPGPQPFVSFRFFIYTDSQSPFLGLLHQILVHAMVNNATAPIGPAHLPGAHRFDRPGGGVGKQVAPVLPIDFATLRWMEQQRAGHGGVTFYFDWNTLGSDESKAGVTQPLQNENVTLAIGPTPFPVNIPQEDWLQILHDVRYRDVAIVEIPIAEDPQSVLARSHEHLETARERLYRADDRGVLVACGEALDVLANARRVKLSKEYGYDSLVQDMLAPIFDSDRKAERLAKVFSGIRQMCLSGKHDEATMDNRAIPVDHNDATLAFLTTSAAISYLEQLPLDEVKPGRGTASQGGRPRPRRRSRRPSQARQDGASGRAHRQPHAGLHELPEIGAQRRRGDDQTPQRVKIAAAQRPVTQGLRAALIAIVQQYAELAADHRERHSDLDVVADSRGLKRADDTGVLHRRVLAVFARYDPSGKDGAGPCQGEELLPLGALRILVTDPHPIAEGGGVERVRSGRIEDEARIMHFQKHIQHPIVNAGQDAEAVRACAVVPPSTGSVRPVVRIPVDIRGGRQHQGR